MQNYNTMLFGVENTGIWDKVGGPCPVTKVSRTAFAVSIDGTTYRPP